MGGKRAIGSRMRMRGLLTLTKKVVGVVGFRGRARKGSCTLIHTRRAAETTFKFKSMG